MRSSGPGAVVVTIGLAGIGVGMAMLRLTVLGWENPILKYLLSAVFIASGIGPIATGVILLRRRGTAFGRSRVPAATLIGIGAIGLVGSYFAFRPDQYTGLAGGLRLALSAIFVVTGGVFVLVGFHWYRERNAMYPLAMLASVIGVGSFFVVHQYANLVFSLPLLAVVVVFVIVGSATVILAINRSLENERVESSR